MFSLLKAELIKHKRNYVPYALLLGGIAAATYVTSLPASGNDSAWRFFENLESSVLSGKTPFMFFLMAWMPLWMGIISDFIAFPDRNNWKILYSKPIRSGYFWGKAILILTFWLVSTIAFALAFSYPILGSANVGWIHPDNAVRGILILGASAFILQIPLFLCLLLLSVSTKRVFSSTFVGLALMAWTLIQIMQESYVEHSPTTWAVSAFDSFSKEAGTIRIPKEKIDGYDESVSSIESVLEDLPKEKNIEEERFKLELWYHFFLPQKTAAITALPDEIGKYFGTLWKKKFLIEWLGWMVWISLLAHAYMRRRQVSE